MGNVNESRYRPVREPIFTETMQIGMVVRDLDATLRKYVDDYGIGPWEVYEFNPGNAKDLHEYGQPVERSWRLAVTQLNSSVGWFLSQSKFPFMNALHNAEHAHRQY